MDLGRTEAEPRKDKILSSGPGPALLKIDQQRFGSVLLQTASPRTTEKAVVHGPFANAI